MMSNGAALAESLLIRPAVPEDLAFIFHTWLKSYRYNSPATLHISHEVYFAKHHQVAEAILKRSVVPVACLRATPNVLVGFAVLELAAPICIHWIYVKNAWRRLGVAKRLLGEIDPNLCVHSHWTSALQGWTNVRWPKLQYDPYLQKKE
jgi:hypothetical protein